MSKSGKRGTYAFVAVFFPLAFLMAVMVLSGGDVIAEDGGDPTPTPQGDWNITEDTVIEGGELLVTGNISVMSGASMVLTDTVLRVNHSGSRSFTMHIYDGATLVAVNSTLDLDTLVAEPQSGIDLAGGTSVHTRGTCYIRSLSLFAEDVVFDNIASSGNMGQDGQDAVIIMDGKVNSEYRNVTIRNIGGDAGPTGPGANGSRGGDSRLYSNVTSWTDSTITCEAGHSMGGGLGIIGGSGGDGGEGGHVGISLRTSHMEGVVIEAIASDGGSGARGARNPAGDGGDGGTGAQGGNARIRIESTSLEIDGCNLLVRSGNGGSGGTGGEAIDGEGGLAGEGGDAGEATVEIQCDGEVVMNGVDVEALAGEGGYGGDYGRHEGGTGTFGSPRPGGDGGDANVVITGDSTLVMKHINVTARGGRGLDGGGGYEQGETGGCGGAAGVSVRVDTGINATYMHLNAVGGDGGFGGPAFSDIRGDGGDGGSANIEVNGGLWTMLQYFEVRSLGGTGGSGYRPIHDGTPGIEGMDIDTLLLKAWEGTFAHPLDDLHGEAEGYLYNVRFDLSTMIHALTLPSAKIWEYYSVDIEYGDDIDREVADPLVDWKVNVFDIETGAIIKSMRTDAAGKVRFWQLSVLYTHDAMTYHGAIYVTCTSPSGSVSHTIRLDVQEPLDIYVYVSETEPILSIDIEKPVQGRTYTFDWRLGDDPDNYLNCSGRIERTDQGFLTRVTVKLYEDSHAGRLVGTWVLPFVTGPGEWGPQIYRPYPDEQRWDFQVGVYAFNESLTLDNGTYMFEVSATDGRLTYIETVVFFIELTGFNTPPVLTIGGHINGTVWTGEEMLVLGEAYDDDLLVRVEYNLDGTGWKTADGKESWQFLINTSLLENGTHNLTIRAVDPYTTSAIHERTFTVDLPEPEGNDDQDTEEDDGWDLYTVPFMAVIILVIALALASAIVIVRRRSPPGSTGEV